MFEDLAVFTSLTELSIPYLNALCGECKKRVYKSGVDVLEKSPEEWRFCKRCARKVYELTEKEFQEVLTD